MLCGSKGTYAGLRQMAKRTQEERVDQDFVEGLRKVLYRKQDQDGLDIAPLREGGLRRVPRAEECECA